MKVSELINELKRIDGDKELNFLVYDGNDNHDARIFINEYDSCLDLELTLEDKSAHVTYERFNENIIDIPLTEDDIDFVLKDVVKRNEVEEWYLTTHGGVDMTLRFMTKDEYEQRGR